MSTNMVPQQVTKTIMVPKQVTSTVIEPRQVTNTVMQTVHEMTTHHVTVQKPVQTPVKKWVNNVEVTEMVTHMVNEVLFSGSISSNTDGLSDDMKYFRLFRSRFLSLVKFRSRSQTRLWSPDKSPTP